MGNEPSSTIAQIFQDMQQAGRLRDLKMSSLMSTIADLLDNTAKEHAYTLDKLATSITQLSANQSTTLGNAAKDLRQLSTALKPT